MGIDYETAEKRQARLAGAVFIVAQQGLGDAQVRRGLALGHPFAAAQRREVLTETVLFHKSFTLSSLITFSIIYDAAFFVNTNLHFIPVSDTIKTV